MLMDNRLEQAHENVLDRIDVWSNSDAEISLVEFLGWTDREYKHYMENNELPIRELEYK